MKKFTDVVTYVRNGAELPAFVVDSREVSGEERLQLLYLDPESGKQQLLTHGTPSMAFAVPPLKDGAKNGWRESIIVQADGEPFPPAVQDAINFAVAGAVTEATKAANYANADLTAEVTKLQQENGELKSLNANLELNNASLTAQLADAHAAVPQTETKNCTDAISVVTDGILAQNANLEEYYKLAGQPSAADLDANAAEKAAKEASPAPDEAPTAEVEAQH